MEDKFKIELVNNLEKVIEWSVKFVNGIKDYSFDIDNNLFLLSEKHGRDFKKRNLLLIYNLTDYYCDAIKHGFEEIDNNYSVFDAENDINFIINHLKSSKDMELPLELEKKIETIFK